MNKIKTINSFKLIVISIFLVGVSSCNQEKRALKKEYRIYHRASMKSQRELAEWLSTQPQEVVDEFKRNYVFTKGAIDSLINSIKDTTIQK
jgi:hypothetical protein